MIEYLQRCRLCHSPNLKEILNLGGQHVQGVFLTKNNSQPPLRRIPNELVWCDPRQGGCTLVQASITPPPEILFSSYFYRSGVNESMREHLKNVVNDLLELNSSPQRVLDIASNDSTLLKNYPKETEKWGVDPNNIDRKSVV